MNAMQIWKYIELHWYIDFLSRDLRFNILKQFWHDSCGVPFFVDLIIPCLDPVQTALYSPRAYARRFAEELRDKRARRARGQR